LPGEESLLSSGNMREIRKGKNIDSFGNVNLKEPSVNSVVRKVVKYSYPWSMFCNTGESSEVIFS